MYNEFTAKFLQLWPVAQLPWHQVTLYDEEQQDVLLEATVLHPLARQFPPSTGYCRRFLKRMVEQIDVSEVALSDKLLHLLDEHINNSDSSNQFSQYEPCFRTFLLPRADETTYVTIREDQTKISGGTTGLRVWSATFKMLVYLWAHPRLITGKRVLELGAGTGLLGLSLMSLHVSQLIMTDGEERVLDRLGENMAIYMSRYPEHADKLSFRLLNWEDMATQPPAVISQTLSMIRAPFTAIGADIVYDPVLIPPLCATLKGLLLNGCEMVVVACHVRNPSTFDLFMKTLFLIQSELTHAPFSIASEQLEDKSAQDLFYVDEEGCPCMLVTLQAHSSMEHPLN